MEFNLLGACSKTPQVSVPEAARCPQFPTQHVTFPWSASFCACVFLLCKGLFRTIKTITTWAFNSNNPKAKRSNFSGDVGNRASICLEKSVGGGGSIRSSKPPEGWEFGAASPIKSFEGWSSNWSDSVIVQLLDIPIETSTNNPITEIANSKTPRVLNWKL